MAKMTSFFILSTTNFSKLDLFSNKVFTSLKKKKRTILGISVIYLISILIRIPRLPGVHGGDSLILVYEARWIIQGYFSKMYANPLSLLSAIPYSPYPVGSVILMIPLLKIFGTDLQLVFFVFYCLISIPTIFYTFKLSNKIFKEKRLAFLCTGIYINLPIIVFYSYASITARLAVQALIPVCCCFLIDYHENKKWLNLFKALMTILVSLFFHRIGFILVVFLILAPFVSFFNDVAFKKLSSSSNKYNKYFTLFYFLIVTLMLNVGYFVGKSLLNYNRDFVFNVNLEIVNYFSYLIGSLWTNWGMIFLLMPFLFVSLYYSKQLEDHLHWDEIRFLLVLFIPSFSALYMLIYARFFFSLFFTIVGVVGYSSVYFLCKKSSYFIGIILILGLLFYYGFYNTFVADLGIYYSIIMIISFVLIFLWLIMIINNNMFDEKSLKLFNDFEKIIFSEVASIKFYLPLFLVLINAVIYCEVETTLTENDILDIGRYMTDDEKEIGLFLLNEERDKNTMFTTFNLVLDKRIAAISGLKPVGDDHGVSQLLVGYAEQQKSCNLKPVYKWFYERSICMETANWTLILYITVLNMDYMSEETRTLLRALNLKYFVSRKGYDLASASEQNNDYKESLFIKTMKQTANCIYSNKKYQIWELL